MNCRLLFIIPLFTISLAAQAAETSPAVVLSETKAQHDARMQWWRDAKFGMFIHWGLYAQAAGEWNSQPPAKDRDQRGEWLMEAVRMPVADYAKMAATFNPVKFDADQWVAMAKDAGVKYIVGDTQAVVNVFAASTTLLMPASNLVVTATYRKLSAPASLRIAGIRMLGETNLVVIGGGGPTNGGSIYWVRSTTNLTLPLSEWSVAATNAFNADGSFSNSLPVTPAASQGFYRIQTP